MARAVSLRHLRGLLQQRNDRTAGDEVFGSDNYVLGRVATIGAAMGQLTPHRMGAERKGPYFEQVPRQYAGSMLMSPVAFLA